jgi:hypothetical protein
VVDELKQLAPAHVQRVAGLVHELTDLQRSDRQKALSDTAGCMTAEEADAFQQTIDEAGERIDTESNSDLH